MGTIGAIMVSQTLGHYRIVDKLGAGGMGEVYRAEDTTLGRQVALKVLPEAFAADPESLARFNREARALASLDHPNIVSIHTVEESDGIQFLTMQLVEGEPLSKMISRGALPVEELCEIAIAMADALASAHGKGIIHRDLKPANVMVTDDGRVKVLDFGLAKFRQDTQAPEITQLLTEQLTGTEPPPLTEALTEALPEAPTEAEPLTRQGMVLGTLPYMSPEQMQGKPVDHRTDIFSLGILLYEMACGTRPFQGENPASLISSTLSGEPEPLTELRPGLPQRLLDTIKRCLRKKPEERVPTARELHAELVELRSEFTTGRTEVARPEPKAAGLRTGARVMIAAAVILAIVAGVVWFSSRGPGEPTEVASQGPQIRSLAVLPMRNLSGDPEQDYLVDGITEALITGLSRIAELQVTSRSSAMRYKGSDKPLAEIARELNVDGLVEGSVAREGDRVAVNAQLIEAATETNLWADRYEREISSILTLQGEVAQAIAQEIRVTLTPQEEALLSSSREVDPEAYEAYLKGQAQFYDLTPAGLEAAQHYFEQALEKDPDYAPAHAGLALVWAGLQQMGLTPPEEAGPKARAAAERALEIDESVAEAHYALALIRAWGDWDWDGAEIAFRRAIELKPNMADVRAYYSHYLLINQRPAEATAQMERALELDPYNALVRVLNGVVLNGTDRCDEALDFYRGVLEATPNQPVALGGMNRSYYCLGRHEEGYASSVAEWTAVGVPEAVAALEAGYAEGGFTGAHRELAYFCVANVDHPNQRMKTYPLWAGIAFAKAGMTSEALDQLDLAFEEHDPNLPYIGVFASLRSLRNEPRFLELLRRMNVPAP